MLLSSKQVHALVISAGAILLAAAHLSGSVAVIVIAYVPVALAVVFGLLSYQVGARHYLPGKPVAAVQAINGLAATLVAIGAVVGSIPITIGAALPDKLEYPAAPAVLATVVGLVVVKTADVLAVDSEAIDKYVANRTEKAFLAAYQPLFVEGKLPKSIPRPDPPPLDSEIDSPYWVALVNPEWAGGWTAAGRSSRAKMMALALGQVRADEADGSAPGV